MKNHINAMILILSVSMASAAMAKDCTQQAITAGVAQYKSDNKDLAYDVGADSAEQTPVGTTGVTAVTIPLHQFDGQIGCGIGVSEIVLMDAQCNVLGRPVELN